MEMKRLRKFGVGLSLLLSTISVMAAGYSTGCPILRHGYGPYDYRTITKEQIVLVEGAHFFPNVENLKEGTIHPNRGYVVSPGKEIDYTLRAFPNHHRALMAMSRLSIRDKTNRPNGSATTVDCYFKLAMDFRPDDSYVFLTYGIHLLRKANTKEAIEYFAKAKELGDDSAMINYNLGLAFFQAKRFDESLDAAHKAYAAGFPLDGLKNMLKRAGKWSEPKPQEQLEAKPLAESSSVEPLSEPSSSADMPVEPAVVQ